MTHGPIRQEYAYDLDKNLTGLTVRSGDTLLAQTSYAYDGNGNRTRKQALDGTTLYQYDALNQLQRVDYPVYSEELFYDKAGNRSRRLLDGEEELYQYDPRNRLMALTRGGVTTPFQYDNAGNLLQDDKAKYTYDAFNRTIQVETFDGNVQVNRYDAEGLRHEMEENGRLVRFIFHKGEAVAEQEENSNVIRLIRGSELIARSSDSESARTYYHYASDEMGSTTHIVDENGNVKNRYAYDAWGKITAKEEAVPNRFTYYGQQIDPITQQYYLRARFYNPVIGRFTQEDTYRGDGLNLYAYCANNPVFYTDISGTDKDSQWGSFNRPVTDTLKVVEETAKSLGVDENYFLEMMQKTADQLTPTERVVMESIRNSIPLPTGQTVLQKVLNPNYVQGYYTGAYLSVNNGRITGCITTVEDASAMKTPQAIFNGLRLDYDGSPFSPMDEVVTAIRFTPDDTSKIIVPYADSMPHPSGGNVSNMTAPFTGHGFTSAQDGQIIPEFYTSGLSLTKGAVMVEIRKTGGVSVIAIYNNETGTFDPVN